MSNTNDPASSSYEDLDLSEIKNKEHEKLASNIETYYTQDLSDKLLRAYTWDESIRFFDGDQHIEYNLTTNKFQQVTVNRNNNFIPRPITNLILPIVRTVTSQLTKRKPQAKVRANSKDPRDLAAGKVGDMVLDVKHEELREDEKNMEKAYWGTICGTVFKKIFWNDASAKVLRIPRMEKVPQEIMDEAGSPVPQVDEAGQPVTDELGTPLNQTEDVEQQAVGEDGEPSSDEFNVGDVDTAIVPPYNIAFSQSARSPLEFGWIMEYSVQKIDWVQRMYDKEGKGYTGEAKNIKAEKDLSTILQLEYRLRTLVGRRSGGLYSTGAGGYIDIENSTVLKEYYSAPTTKHPKGRMVIVASGKTLFSDDNPYYDPRYADSWNPYVEWRFELVPGRAWGKGLVEELVPLNRRVNAIDSIVVLNRKTMAIGQWLIPEGSGVPNGYINGRPGLNIPYRPVGANGAKPEKIDGTPLPQQVYQEREQTVVDMKRIGMTQDVLEGTNPQGVKTAYQLEQLLENALAQMGGVFQRWEKSYEREEIKKLLLISKRYKEPREEFGRKLKAINKGITDIELDMFMGADLRDNVDVRVEANSSIPRSKAGENAVIRELVQGKVLDVVANPANKREFMDKMGIKGFDLQSSPDLQRAQWENSIIENGRMEDLIVKPEEPMVDPATGEPVIDPNTGQPAQIPPSTVLELDDHEAHIIVHAARMKDPNISPEVRDKYLGHTEEHLQKLAEAAAAQAATGAMGPGAEVGGEQKTNREGAEQISRGETT